jgi:glycosyltransferase involved in cell wall biosynthesis
MKTIGIFPFGKTGNPYTEMLAEGIADAGYAVRHLQDTKIFPLRRAAQSGVDALHLLWPGNLYHSSTRAGTCLKRLMFYDGLRCLARVPAVYSADNLYSHDAADVGFEISMIQKIVSRVRAVTVASAEAERLFLIKFKLPQGAHIFRVPHRHYIGKYADTVSKAEARSRLSLPPNSPVVLSLGRITPYKGLPGLVGAFLGAAVKGSILLIAGSETIPGTVASIESSAERLGRSGDVRIHNRFIPDDQMQLYLRAADLMALSYEDVPMNPGSVILAMSFGLPVCCVSEGSVPEILGETLYGYPRGDFVEQSNALRRALVNPAQLAELGKVARARAETNHSPGVIATRLAETYRHVLP